MTKIKPYLIKIHVFFYRNIYKFLWILFNRFSAPVTYFAHYPSFYIIMFRNVHKLLPRIPIIPSNKKGIKEVFKKEGIAYNNFFGFPKVVITSDFPSIKYPPNTIKFVNTLHGIGEKNYLYNAEYNKRYAYHLAPGEYTKNRLLKIGVPEESVFVVGFPKLDALFNEGVDKEKYLKEANFKEEKPIVLYAPTCRDDFNSLDYVTPQIEEAAKKYNIIVKLHPGYSPESGDYGKKWIELFSKMENVYLAPFEDPIPYMYISDLLINDAGSMMFEFAAMNKPLLLAPVKTTLEKEGGYDKNSIEHRWRDIGLELDKNKTLTENIDLAFQTKDQYEDKRKNYSEQLFYKLDGKSSIRAKDAILEILKINSIDKNNIL